MTQYVVHLDVVVVIRPEPPAVWDAEASAPAVAEDGDVTRPVAAWRSPVLWVRPPPGAAGRKAARHSGKLSVHSTPAMAEDCMANFPYREPDIIRLAQDVARGLAAHPEIFPDPPFTAEELDQSVADYNANRERSIASKGTAVQDTAAKKESLKVVLARVRATLRFAEGATGRDEGKLQLLGWGAPRPRTSAVLQLPGQVVTLAVEQEGVSWIKLRWQEPFDGGQVAACRVQRRKRDTGDWTDVGMSVGTDVTLNGQESGVEFEYRVIAVNKSGEGPASNIVRAVL